MLIQNFKTFKRTLCPYEIEGPFGAIIEKGYRMEYGLAKSFKVGRTQKEAYKTYKERAETIDMFIKATSFLVDTYLDKCRVYDNGGETIDRYTIVYPGKVHGNLFYVASCHTGNSFFQHGEMEPQRSYSHLGSRILFTDLPQSVQVKVRADVLK